MEATDMRPGARRVKDERGSTIERLLDVVLPRLDITGLASLQEFLKQEDLPYGTVSSELDERESVLLREYGVVG